MRPAKEQTALSGVRQRGGAPSDSQVRRQLERVLDSPAFRGSKRCQEFLRFVVEQKLQGNLDSLKERTLGIELFGRDPDYVTSEDAIVRVKANEVRKRLAQYYVESGHQQEVWIDLPAGSYVPEFHWHPNGDSFKPKRRFVLAFPSLRWPAVVFAVVLAAFLIGAFLKPFQSPAERFWAPVMEARRPVLICSGHPVVYLLRRRVHERFKSLHPNLPPGPYVIRLPANEITGDDVVPTVGQYVGLGDDRTVAALTAWFGRTGKPYQLRTGNNITFADLKDFPAVLIGFSNLWTLEMTKEFRFVFEMRDGVKMVSDRNGTRRWALPNIAPDGRTTEDYAIVSRVFERSTGQVLISVGGLTQYGTGVAGEFLANPESLSRALAGAPKDWPRKNLQFLLHTKIVGDSAAAPTVVDRHFW